MHGQQSSWCCFCCWIRHQRSVAIGLTLWSLLLVPAIVNGNLPTFDEDSRMRILLLPFATRPSTTIYRIRAADPDFAHPLEFIVTSKTNPGLVYLETIPCGKQHSMCEANVVLNQTVDLGMTYELSLAVRDTSGEVTTVSCTIQVTNSSSPLSDVFQHLNQYITVPENLPKETVVDYLIAWQNPSNNRGIRMELKNQGMRYFRLADKLAGANRTNCSIILERSLDFEVQTVHILRILALNAYVDSRFDTRNVVEVIINIFVMDIQDTAPIFVSAPPITSISDKMESGKVVLKVKAEDGDKGNPRQITYAVLADSSPFAPFFYMDPQTGELKVRKKLTPLNQMVHSNAPFLLKIIAEEIGSGFNDSNTVTTIELALLLEDETNDAPEFNQERYVAHLMENAPVGTALYFGEGQNPQVTDNDKGHNGIFSLSLSGDNSTFEISPSVAENSATFSIRVKNPALIDFERTQQIRFKVLAEEVQHGSNRVSTAEVTVYIMDDNDHTPIFEKETYSAEIAEHSPPGTVVIQVKASDIDSGRYGTVRYTQLHGVYANAFLLDPISGLITVGSGLSLDREVSPEITLTVEVRDNEGTGRAATVPVVVRLLDINDNAPHFVGLPYEVSLTPDFSRFTSRVVVQAVDNDTNPMNGAVRYEIVRGNYESKFKINEITGEVTLTAPLTAANPPSLIQLQVRAYDLGVPHLHAETMVQIYTQEVTARSIHFIIPKRMDSSSTARAAEETKRMESLLSMLTGAPTTIDNVQTYPEDTLISERIENLTPENQKSRLITTVRFPPHASVIDLERIHRALVTNEFELTSGTTIEQEYRYKNGVLVWVVAVLVLAFATIMLLLAICCCCPGCYCYNDRKVMNHRYSKNVRPVMVVDGRSGIGSQLTTPGRKEAWSGNKRVSRVRRQTRDRLSSLSEAGTMSKRTSDAFVSRQSVNNGPMQQQQLTYNDERDVSMMQHQPNARQHFMEEHSDVDFLDIQPEDSASHHGAGEKAFYYQRMGNADVMRLETSVNRNNRRMSNESSSENKGIRRSNSEPRLIEPPDMERVADDGRNASKSMVDFPQHSSMDDQLAIAWRIVNESQQHQQSHRNSQTNKYVQSPILEETDSALERELQTASSFYLRPKTFLEYNYGGGGTNRSLPPGVESRVRQAWQRNSVAATAAANPTVAESITEERRLARMKRELERELPYFNNRSSFLRHRVSLSRKAKAQKNTNNRFNDADGSASDRSVSSNDFSHRESRRNSSSGPPVPVLLFKNRAPDDERDSGIALNANNRNRFLEKKSIFTIAYDEIATTKIPDQN